MIKRNRKSRTARLQSAPEPQPTFAATVEKAGASAAAPAAAKPRHDGWTAARKAQFCAVLGQMGTVEEAALIVGLSRAAAYGLRARDAAFARDWDAARHGARQRLIDRAVELAFEGRTIRRVENGRLIEERRRNSPAQVLGVVRRMRTKALLGNPRVIAASRDFALCLDLLKSGVAFPDPDASETPPVSEAAAPAKGWSTDEQAAFCRALAQCGNVDRACAAIGRPRSTAYATRHQAGGQAFAIAWDAALLFASEQLIDVAMELARNGSVDQVIKGGRVVRERRTVSARTMLDFAARLGAVLAPVDVRDTRLGTMPEMPRPGVAAAV